MVTRNGRSFKTVTRPVCGGGCGGGGAATYLEPGGGLSGTTRGFGRVTIGVEAMVGAGGALVSIMSVLMRNPLGDLTRRSMTAASSALKHWKAISYGLQTAPVAGLVMTRS